MNLGEEVRYVPGGTAIDDRGKLSFINDLSLAGLKRFYLVQNHRQGFIRAWHGHKIEGKAVVAIRGSALVCGVKVDDWQSPSKDLPVSRQVLSSDKFGALWIPPGHANGFMSLSKDCILMFLSTSSLGESAADDIRFPSRHWNPWDIEER
jgi:dTDP-4-dehydrorhamnose 3,5-epimerase